jgi:anaerobic selenocysteine-containing dehydrogenase
MLDLTLRPGPFGDRYGEVPDGITLDRLKEQPHGVDLGPNVPCIGQILTTASGRVELTPPYITADLPRLARRLERPPADLVLVSRRDLRSNNSWMHNVPVLMKGKPRCTLLVHPDDARRRGITDGDLVTVTSEAGTLDVQAEITDGIRPGVACLPHGWGHDKPGTRLSVARDHPGVNSNVLAPGTFIDEISGNAAVNGIPISVTPAASG